MSQSLSSSPQVVASVPPRLAPPGAGIPRIERWIGGAIFGIRRRLGTHEKFAADFRQERALIAQLCEKLDDRACKRRVLIPRLRGLEDSSRFWSIWMTLDHLRIVNDEIHRVITSLAQNNAPTGQVSTAAVKPSENVEGDVVPRYEQSCERLVETMVRPTTLRSTLTHAHPWFGPLDLHGWKAMAAMHMAIHRKQIERIAEGLHDAKR